MRIAPQAVSDVVSWILHAVTHGLLQIWMIVIVDNSGRMTYLSDEYEDTEQEECHQWRVSHVAIRFQLLYSQRKDQERPFRGISWIDMSAL